MIVLRVVVVVAFFFKFHCAAPKRNRGRDVRESGARGISIIGFVII